MEDEHRKKKKFLKDIKVRDQTKNNLTKDKHEMTKDERPSLPMAKTGFQKKMLLVGSQKNASEKIEGSEKL